MIYLNVILAKLTTTWLAEGTRPYVEKTTAMESWNSNRTNDMIGIIVTEVSKYTTHVFSRQNTRHSAALKAIIIEKMERKMATIPIDRRLGSM